MPNPKNITNHQFKPGQSGNPNGRPPEKARLKADLVAIFGKKEAGRLMRELEEADGKERSRLWNAVLRMMNASQVMLVAKSDTVNIEAKANAVGILTDMKNGRTTTIDKINERLDGKPAQQMKLTGADGAGAITIEVIDSRDKAEGGGDG